MPPPKATMLTHADNFSQPTSNISDHDTQTPLNSTTKPPHSCQILEDPVPLVCFINKLP